MHIIKRVAAVMAACTALSGCGEGGSGGNSTPPTSMPTPTPTPTPTATPTPAPAPVSFRAVLGNGLIGRATFDVSADGAFGNSSSEGGIDTYDYSNRFGEFGIGTLNRINTSGQPPATANAAIQVFGVDSVTGFYYADLRVASGVRIVSPTTSLLRFVDDDVVAANTRIGLNARQLGAFDYPRKLASQDEAERTAARRMQAFDMKLIAYAFIGSERSVKPDGGINFHTGLVPVAERLAQGAIDLNDPVQVDAILVRYSNLSYTTDVQRKALVQLLARYGQAVDSYLVQGGTPARIQYGLHLSILPQVEAIKNSNSASPAGIAALTVSDLVAEFERYVDLPSQFAPPGLFAVPDVRTVKRQSLDSLVLSGCESTQSPICNDLSVTNTVSSLEGTRVEFATVAPQFAKDISLSLDGNNALVIRRLTTDRKTVWINYTARSPAGQASSRLYLRLNEED